mmetsp:Transcript_15043/g.34878  ORF Transcript_15043/g.34878 Transcript_15043/m.34878 type:complete len:544 (+) Transcript_15043:157-1788(+)|eukprot:CAMPEP_0197185982 /NCGR_PEP_ID=MMETSP1423-20130617/12983_1 /TAXON_ID=476441 /ORGANISM="Pseudo-nitzschia heimii, Strain UNC1101" /LENGTH=543 /DNA_ID=CAMNT_0042637175 /DNA_START=144 /DNA_END=1775 /DNA_ORIENTATION=+
MLRSILVSRISHKNHPRALGSLIDRSPPCRLLSATISTATADLCVIGGGPIGTEVARLSSVIGLSDSTVVIDPRGCMLVAPTGYVSKVLLDVSHKVASGARGSRFVWDYAEEALECTANRALNLTRMQFDNIGTGQMPDVIAAEAAFEGIDDETNEYIIRAKASDGSSENIRAKTVFVATGSRSTRLSSLPWPSSQEDSSSFLYDSDSIRSIGRVPEHIVIQGGGVIGVEYAFIFRRLGARVTLCLREAAVLEGKLVDQAISRAVGKRLHEAGIEVRYQDGDIERVEVPTEEGAMTGKVILKNSGDVLTCDAMLSALGRAGCADCLDIENVSLTTYGGKGHITTDDDLRALTSTGDLSRIFVVGDAVGEHTIVQPAGLLSTGLAEAHIAVRAAFPHLWHNRFPAEGRREINAPFEKYPASAIWMEDGVAFCGLTESRAIEEFGRESVGVATTRYEESVKACVQPRPADEFLKLVYNKSTGVILGVHIFGKDASEMVNHPAAFINRQDTIWDALHSVPPAVTYDEIFIKAADKASWQIAQGNGG